MQTFKSMMQETGIKYSTLRYRVKILGLDTRYHQNETGQIERVFTPEEAEKLTMKRDWREREE